MLRFMLSSGEIGGFARSLIVEAQGSIVYPELVVENTFSLMCMSPKPGIMISMFINAHPPMWMSCTLVNSGKLDE